MCATQTKGFWPLLARARPTVDPMNRMCNRPFIILRTKSANPSICTCSAAAGKSGNVQERGDAPRLEFPDSATQNRRDHSSCIYLFPIGGVAGPRPPRGKPLARRSAESSDTGGAAAELELARRIRARAGGTDRTLPRSPFPLPCAASLSPPSLSPVSRRCAAPFQGLQRGKICPRARGRPTDAWRWPEASSDLARQPGRGRGARGALHGCHQCRCGSRAAKNHPLQPPPPPGCRIFTLNICTVMAAMLLSVALALSLSRLASLPSTSTHPRKLHPCKLYELTGYTGRSTPLYRKRSPHGYTRRG